LEPDLGSASDPTRAVTRAGTEIQHRDRFPRSGQDKPSDRIGDASIARGAGTVRVLRHEPDRQRPIVGSFPHRPGQRPTRTRTFVRSTSRIDLPAALGAGILYTVAPVDVGTRAGRILSVTGSRTEMIERVVWGAHTALEFERKEKESSPWHDIVAITHQVPMEEVVDEQGRVLPFLDEHPDQERLYVFTLNRGFTPNRTEIAWVQRARVQGRRLLYIAESDDVVVPASFPPAPLVAARHRETIAEAVRVWARAAMDTSAGRDLYLPESGIDLRPDADVAALTGSLRVVNGLLIERLRRVPELMHQLHPRAFEELVAELLAARGYDVTLTPFSGDGGRDILAVSHRSWHSRSTRVARVSGVGSRPPPLRAKSEHHAGDRICV
jgi:hypothetical protein